MKNPRLQVRLSVAVAALSGMAVLPAAQAALVSGPDIIAAPSSVIDDAPGAVNDHQQAFDERQGITLVTDLAVDGGLIPSGTVVDSHMIFLNTPGNTAASDTETWGFDGLILGVMSNNNGSLEAASSALLGAIGTTYPAAFNNRGLENADSYAISGSQITVEMSVTEPGDWIRVITRSVPGTGVPDGGSTALLLAPSLAGLFAVTRRFRRAR